MTAETSNARGEWVLVPREPTEAMLDAMHSRIRILCDPAERTASIQNDREVWAAMLAAAPPPAAEGVQAEPRPVLSEPDRIGLYQGPDDCPQLMVNDRPVAIFPAGSWAKVCDALDSITGSVQPDPKPEARGVVDDLIHAARNAATVIRNCVNARQIGKGYAYHADDLDAAIAALTEARNVR